MAIEKSKDRLQVLERIDEYERKGWFTKDVEEDPPTIPLLPEQIDYTDKKLSSRINCKIATFIGISFVKKMIKKGFLVLAEPEGLENYEEIKDKGALITCNHFNAFDNFALFFAIDKYLPHHRLWRVIREGNYTNFRGFYGYLFKHCNTLPLSQNFSTQKKFMAAIKELLEKKEKILIFAEQGMWWNYRKPRPLTAGAYKFAAQNNVPVLPCFITLRDTENIGPDGFPIQEYKVHIMKAIYPDAEKSLKENVEYMKNLNYQMNKDLYEKTYGIPLEYLKDEESEKSKSE
jgi:1-acyl-sn-glycerol-3-phosphate acyltransferase